jgi:hypothetical protein
MSKSRPNKTVAAPDETAYFDGRRERWRRAETLLENG